LQRSVLVLGIGNTLLGDDGVGIYVARKMRETCSQEGQIDIAEANGGGIALLDFLSGYTKVVIIDAIITKKGKPGTLYKLSLEDLGTVVEPYMLHAIDLRTAVELGRMLGYHIPEDITLYAIEIRNNTIFTEGLSDDLEAVVPSVIKQITSDLT
jgi:hydrogenase maturation protease